MYWKERYTLVNYHLNKDGLCDAFISWSVVNRFGKNDKKGEYIYVDEFWKHKNINFKTILRDFINKMKSMTQVTLSISIGIDASMTSTMIRIR